MAAVKKNDVAKVTKLTDKGLDPNFIDLEHGGGQLQFLLFSACKKLQTTTLVPPWASTYTKKWGEQNRKIIRSKNLVF